MRKVVLVEDELVWVFRFKKYLERSSCQVIDAVPDGKTAVEAIRKGQPDLVVLDLHLPGEWSSLRTLKTIRQLSQVPVVLVAGAGIVTTEEVFEMPYTRRLVKPVKEQDLQQAVEELLNSQSLSIPPFE